MQINTPELVGAAVCEAGDFPHGRRTTPWWRMRFVWLNRDMFARRIRVDYIARGEDKKQPCPLKWLDSFSMRNFTNASVFDDTLPVADGCMEIGTNVPLNRLRDAMEDWFRRKSYLPKEADLSLEESS